MSFTLAPVAPPEAVPVVTTPSPRDDEIAPISAVVIPVQVPLPSVSPPESGDGSSISPAPTVAFPPVVPIVSQPTLPPIQSQIPSFPQPQPQPQPQPEPPAVQPTPVTKDIPTPTFSPPDSTPVTVIETPPKIPSARPPKTGPETTKPGLIKPSPSSDTSPPLPSSEIPSVKDPKTRPATTKSSQLRPSPTSVTTETSPPLPASEIPSVRHSKTRPAITNNNMPAEKQSESPLAASAVLPSQPPVALPVPQTPHGEAWLPSASVPPSILPSIPDSPAEVNAPPFSGETDGNNGTLPSSSSSFLGPAGSNHQNIQAAGPSSGGSNVLVVGLVVCGILALLFGAVFGILVYFCRRKHKKFDDIELEELHASSLKGFEGKTSLPKYTKQGPNIPGYKLPTDTTTPEVGKHFSSGTFAYDELVAATSGFSDQNLLGQGGFGYVHKGVLPNGKEVAVKQLKMGGDQGEREFQSEVDTISQVHHKHLVSLVGYCISGPERLLVYEFVANNTLDFHLHGKDQPVMDWPTRLKIAIGSAKGLAYLHEDCSPSIIHRDIKAANILLDFNFEAKVSDFGLAKIFSSTNPTVTHMTTRVVGTFGYLAPEYASSGKVTDKSDVYSYGVVLLELITGRPPISNFGPATNGSLVNWARPLLAQAIADGNFDGLADSRLQNNYNVDEMASMVSCAAACVRLSSWRRPRLSQVIRALEGNLSPSELDGVTKAGHSATHFPYESFDFDPRNYLDDMKKMALASSRYSDNTSDYGLNHSTSSTDSTHHIC